VPIAGMIVLATARVVFALPVIGALGALLAAC
jgi:hypothetical protein